MTNPAGPEPGEIRDPDLAAAEGEVDRKQAEDERRALTTDELLPEDRLVEYEPPDAPSRPTAEQMTEAEERAGETIDDRLTEEEPDASTDVRPDQTGDDRA
ncbi:MAG TPA: hypothetical protein VF053_15925 [Streptosporangiales bacterium]